MGVAMTGIVVVGVDGSEQAQRALSWAIEEARLRHAHLTVVHAWRFGAAPTDPNGAEEVRQIGLAAQHLLDHEVGFARDAGVEVDGRLMFDAPARALLDAAATADLLVVGNRGRGALASTLLGSVSTACVHHAPCPVVVVSDTGDRAESTEPAPTDVANAS
jgi:nucleotide-binding universal stress UspA family protein